MTRRYFTDRDLGKRFPEILAGAGFQVERHHDRFQPDGPDEEWLAYCGRLGLVAITHDVRIRYRPNELAAVQRHGVTLLVVVGKAPLPELARSFVASRRRIEALLDSQGPPLIAKVYRPGAAELAKNPDAPGDVRLWYPAAKR